MLKATVCRYEHFETEWYRRWAEVIGMQYPVRLDVQTAYRKAWEYAAILEILRRAASFVPTSAGLALPSAASRWRA